MDDLACPRCKTTKYRNPSLKLLVNTCGHALCDNCVENLFIKGSGACPECGIALRRSGFRLQLFEDPTVEKEVDIRKRVLKDFTKQESDFDTLRQYNDYLEEVETIIFNLVNNIDFIETNKMIEQYKKENKDQIAKSRNRKPQEILKLEAILEEEQKRGEYRRLENLAWEKEEKIRKLKRKEELIDDLMFCESEDAKSIVERHKQSASLAVPSIQDSEVKLTPILQPTTFTSGIGFGGGTFLPVPKQEEVPLFTYRALLLSIGGPDPPSLEELKGSENKYLNHIRAANEAEIAGGYHHALACRRALQDAFMDIALQPKYLKREDYQQEEMDVS